VGIHAGCLRRDVCPQAQLAARERVRESKTSTIQIVSALYAKRLDVFQEGRLKERVAVQAIEINEPTPKTLDLERFCGQLV